MKSKAIQYLSLAVMLIITTLNFSSCEIIYSDSSTDLLCGPQWRDTWYDDFGDYYEQTFTFYTDGTGTEYYYDGMPHYYNFYWHWENYERSIAIAYGPNDVSYFNNIEISRGILSGYLNGEYVEFEAW